MQKQTHGEEAVLIADDSTTSRKMLKSAVDALGFQSICVANGQDAWTALSAPDGPSIALIDWVMPEMTGLELVSKLRAEMGSKILYLIMVTARSSSEEVIEGIEQGADDYVIKPFNRKELAVRIRAGERIVKLQRELVSANRQLETLARTDTLTGFYNRLALQHEMTAHSERPKETRSSTAFIMTDLDHFKRVNDEHGHDAGDAVLKQFSDRVRALLRPNDVVFRMGGEEFLLIAAEADEADALRISERVRINLQDTPFELPDGTALTITCSLGVHVETHRIDKDFDRQIKKADEALYLSKNGGRNRVTVYSAPGNAR